MAQGIEHQRMATDTGYWPLYRFDPRRAGTAQPPLVLDSPPPKGDVGALMALETRFQLTDQQDHAHYEALVERARHQIAKRAALYHDLAPAERRALHREAARTLASTGAPAAEVAHHLIESGPDGAADAIAQSIAASRLASAGQRVCVLERAEPPAGATNVAAGMLAPVGELTFGEPELLQMTLAAAQLYPDFVAELEEASGVATGYARCGALHIALDRDEAAELRRVHDLQRSLGLEAEWLPPRRCRGSRIPNSRPHPSIWARRSC